MVVGSDRVKEFENLLKKYNGVKARHGFYKFEEINILSAGERDPDADDVTGMSASKMKGTLQRKVTLIHSNKASYHQETPEMQSHCTTISEKVWVS